MGMKVTLEKVYKRLDHTASRGFPRITQPSIEIIDVNNPGSTSEKLLHYVSNKCVKPVNESEMTLAETLDASSLYGLQTTVTWSLFKNLNPSANLEVYIEGQILSDEDEHYNCQ